MRPVSSVVATSIGSRRFNTDLIRIVWRYYSLLHARSSHSLPTCTREDVMPVRAVRTFALVLGLTIPIVESSAQSAAPATNILKVEDYLNYETVADPRISPDGTQVVYSRRWVNRMDDRIESALWIVGADGSKNRFLTK